MGTDNVENSGSAETSEWIERLYDELHAVAGRYMHNEQNTVSLSPTVLIHELYLRMPKSQGEQLSRTHFMAIAAVTMRRALVDHARYRKRQKRGGTSARRQSIELDLITANDSEDVLMVDEALTDLVKLDSRQAKIVELRFFGGMTVEEVALHLNLSKRTVEADWTMAKAWLRRWFTTEGGGF